MKPLLRNSFIFIFLVPLWACQPTVSPGLNTLTVSVAETALRAQPGEQSTQILILEQGLQVTDLGRVSNFETPLQFGGATVATPWVMVETADNQRGFVPAITVRPVQRDYEDWLLQKRMICYFGPRLTEQVGKTRRRAEGLRNDADFAAYFQQIKALRDTLSQALAQRPEPNAADFQPDFSWLAGVLPGFVVAQPEQQRAPGWQVDYRHFHKLAALTAGKQDDEFIQLCLTAFPIDSIESPLPVWVFPVSATESHSNLGGGKHLAMLEAIEQAKQTCPLFQKEIAALKDRLLEDILGKDRTYWQPQEKILAELQAILDASLTCLDDTDRLALEERLLAFTDPAVNAIKVNLRSGQ